MIQRVEITNFARKQIRRLPKYIVDNPLAWVDDVETKGLEETRKIPGYHDEPLKGDRAGQRSIRLSLAYRAIYVVHDGGLAELVSIEEVSKHDY